MLRSRPAPALKATLFAALLLALAACGGGGGGGGGFSNPLPSGPIASGTPVFGIGNGSGTTYTDGQINASQTTLRSGESATLRVNVVAVNRDNEPPTTAQTVTFSSTCSA